LRKTPAGSQASLERLERCLEPICKALDIAPERKKLADGLLRKSYQKPLCRFLSCGNDSSSVEATLRSMNKETLDEKRFTQIFKCLEHEDVLKVQSINLALGAFIQWTQCLLSYHVMVHPYRMRNRESIKYNLAQGDIVLDFADTVEDFMNQFYAFKAYLIKIEFLAKDAHFAFNLSNINSQNFDRRPSKVG
jgi:hypothetical protein